MQWVLSLYVWGWKGFQALLVGWCKIICFVCTRTKRPHLQAQHNYWVLPLTSLLTREDSTPKSSMVVSGIAYDPFTHNKNPAWKQNTCAEHCLRSSTYKGRPDPTARIMQYGVTLSVFTKSDDPLTDPRFSQKRYLFKRRFKARYEYTDRVLWATGPHHGEKLPWSILSTRSSPL